MKKIIFICVLCFSTLSFAELGSSIFSFDGQDFIRTDTTLIDENGNLAINTKMDRNYPGYKALLKKKSISSPSFSDITVFNIIIDLLSFVLMRSGLIFLIQKKAFSNT
jgi:hypothetical protein